MIRRCDRCGFYEPMSNDEGFCHRLPPIVPAWLVEGDAARTGKGLWIDYFVATPPWGWCGEFKEREKEK